MHHTEQHIPLQILQGVHKAPRTSRAQPPSSPGTKNFLHPSLHIKPLTTTKPHTHKPKHPATTHNMSTPPAPPTAEPSGKYHPTLEEIYKKVSQQCAGIVTETSVPAIPRVPPRAPVPLLFNRVTGTVHLQCDVYSCVDLEPAQHACLAWERSPFNKHCNRVEPITTPASSSNRLQPVHIQSQTPAAPEPVFSMEAHSMSGGDAGSCQGSSSLPPTMLQSIDNSCMDSMKEIPDRPQEMKGCLADDESDNVQTFPNGRCVVCLLNTEHQTFKHVLLHCISPPESCFGLTHPVCVSLEKFKKHRMLENTTSKRAAAMCTGHQYSSPVHGLEMHILKMAL